MRAVLHRHFQIATQLAGKRFDQAESRSTAFGGSRFEARAVILNNQGCPAIGNRQAEAYDDARALAPPVGDGIADQLIDDDRERHGRTVRERTG